MRYSAIHQINFYIILVIDLLENIHTQFFDETLLTQMFF